MKGKGAPWKNKDLSDMPNGLLRTCFLQRRNTPENVRKPDKTALEGSVRSLRDGIDGFTGKENIRSFIMIVNDDISRVEGLVSV